MRSISFSSQRLSSNNKTDRPTSPHLTSPLSLFLFVFLSSPHLTSPHLSLSLSSFPLFLSLSLFLQEFEPSPGAKMVTMGAFVCDLILDQYYFETIFPRIPEVARRALVVGRCKLDPSLKAPGLKGSTL